MFSLLIFSLMALKLFGKRYDNPWCLSSVFVVGVLLCPSLCVAPAQMCLVFLDRDLKTTGGAPYFSSYVDIIFDLYVLVTTANSPDVM